MSEQEAYEHTLKKVQGTPPDTVPSKLTFNHVPRAFYPGTAKPVPPKEQGARHNEGKPQLSFIVLGREVAAGEAAVWAWGAAKYARGNWLKGMSWTQSADSLLRHVTALLNGEDLDPETGLPHADHLVCSAKILSNSYHTRPDLDDREKKES